jgi:hypothetical protein
MDELPIRETLQDLLGKAHELESNINNTIPEGKNGFDEPPNDVALLLGQKETVRIKRKIEKLKDEHLTSPKGFLKLVKLCEKVKSLPDLIKIIQIWGHELFSKHNTKDLIAICLKICSQRRMRVFRDEILNEQRRKRLKIYTEKDNGGNLY